MSVTVPAADPLTPDIAPTPNGVATMSDTSTGLTSVDRIPDVAPIDTPVDRQHLVDQRPLADQLRRATSLIAPLWRLEDYVAVNPYLGMTDLRFSDAAQRLDMVAGVRSTLPAAFYLDAVERGRITRDDLVAAIATPGRVVFGKGRRQREGRGQRDCEKLAPQSARLAVVSIRG